MKEWIGTLIGGGAAVAGGAATAAGAKSDSPTLTIFGTIVLVCGGLGVIINLIILILELREHLSR